MFSKKKDDIKLTIVGGFDRIIEEQSNSFVALRKLKWTEDGTARYDLRRYRIDADGNEVVGKGLGFTTEEGPHELANVLVEEGFGDTTKIIRSIMTRGDFSEAMEKAANPDSSDEEEGINLEDVI